MNGERIFIALGSNLGDRRGHLERGLASLAARPSIRLVRSSSFHWTPPWGRRDQPWFLNAAAEIDADLGPRDLLDVLLGAEASLGRVRTEHNGPRTLDLDLLLYGDRVQAGPDLLLPHPRMGERAFVLAPLAEIAPDVVHPVEKITVLEMLRRLGPAAATGLLEEPAHERA